MALDQILAAQYGCVTTAQAAEGGVTRHALAHAVQRGRLLRVHPRVYVTSASAATDRGRFMAALLYAGPESVLSHGSAAVLHALGSDAATVHVSVRRGSPCRPRPGLLVHAPPALDDVDVRELHALPVTALERTVMDQCGRLPRDRLRVALVAEVLQEGRTTADRLRAAAERAGSAWGARRLRALLDGLEQLDGPESVLEVEFLRLVRRCRLPAPAVQVPLTLPSGRRVRVDVLWANVRLVVELDGRRFHLDPETWEDGLLRDADLSAAGYEVLHVSWRQLRDSPRDVLDRVGAAIARRSLDMAPVLTGLTSSDRK